MNLGRVPVPKLTPGAVKRYRRRSAVYGHIRCQPAGILPEKRATIMSMLKVVLVTGISGSGKSVALRMLEDASYTCVDNLPVRFLTEFIANARDDGLERVAVAIDVRSPGELAELPDVVTALRAMGTSLRVVFLDASTDTLVQRYSESRRRHPLTDRLQRGGTAPSLTDCIALERELLAPLREQEHVIDTSELTPDRKSVV